jgi:hypothetical protein
MFLIIWFSGSSKKDLYNIFLIGPMLNSVHDGGNLGFRIHIKSDYPMIIHLQFGFNHVCSS